MAACARSLGLGCNSSAASTSLSACKQQSISACRNFLTSSIIPQSSRKCLTLSSSRFTGNTQALQPQFLAAEQKLADMRITCGGFIPAEHRWMYEGLQNLGPDKWETTYYPKEDDHLNINKTWYVVDASQKKLGRLASAIAYHIRGKHVPEYTPSLDMGAYVIVVNAENIEVSGKKRSQKMYRRHSGRPGGMKEETFDQLQKRIPERIIEHAVKGMLPKGRLGRRLFTHLKVYKGSEHPHIAQRPVPLPIKDKHCFVTE